MAEPTNTETPATRDYQKDFKEQEGRAVKEQKRAETAEKALAQAEKDRDYARGWAKTAIANPNDPDVARARQQYQQQNPGQQQQSAPQQNQGQQQQGITEEQYFDMSPTEKQMYNQSVETGKLMQQMQKTISQQGEQLKAVAHQTGGMAKRDMDLDYDNRFAESFKGKNLGTDEAYSLMKDGLRRRMEMNQTAGKEYKDYVEPLLADGVLPNVEALTEGSPANNIRQEQIANATAPDGLVGGEGAGGELAPPPQELKDYENPREADDALDALWEKAEDDTRAVAQEIFYPTEGGE